MTIEWTDGFPDHMPPKLTAEEAVERIEGVLKAARIDVAIGSCGCCPPWMTVTFPDGAEFDGDISTIVADGLNEGR